MAWLNVKCIDVGLRLTESLPLTPPMNLSLTHVKQKNARSSENHTLKDGKNGGVSGSSTARRLVSVGGLRRYPSSTPSFFM